MAPPAPGRVVASPGKASRSALGGLIALAALAGSAFALDGQETQAEPRTKKDRLADPWPDAEQLRARRVAAENLPLFKATEPLAVQLAADFKAVNKDRTVDSPKRFPGVLTVAGEGGAPVAIPVRLGTRGNLRLNPRTCSFVPLRVELSKKDVKGTLFEGQGSLKLVTHCQDSSEHEQYVLGEALAYRIANVLTPESYRVRLLRARYVDPASGKTVAERPALFVEDDDDVARRMEGRIAPLKKLLFRNLHQPSMLRLMVFQVLIGNTDFSIHALHNTRLVQDREGRVRPIAYDFDVSGLVHPPYAAANPKLRIASVRDRLYRGPCLPLEQLEPTLAEFRARRAEVLALCDSVPGMNGRTRTEAKDYLGEFFDIIGNSRRAKFLFVDKCRQSVGM